MDGNSSPTREPGNLDDNSNSCQLNAVRSKHANAKEILEDVTSVSPEECEGHADVTSVHVSVPSNNDFPTEMTSEELVRSDSKNESELEMRKSDSKTMQVDNVIQDYDATYISPNEARVKKITRKYSGSPVWNSNNNRVSATNVDSIHDASGNADILLNDNCDRNIVDPLNTEVKRATKRVSLNNNSERCQTESLSPNIRIYKAYSLPLSNTYGKGEGNASEDHGVNVRHGSLLVDRKCNDTIEASVDCSNAEAKTSAKDEASDKKEDADDFDDALDYVEDHFAENSDDEKKVEPEEQVLMCDLSDVGRYSYACLVAHALYTLFGYSSSNRLVSSQGTSLF